MSSLNFSKANDLLDQYVNIARHSFGSEVNLQLIEGKATLPCDDSASSSHTGPVTTTAAYHVNGVNSNFSKSQNSFIHFWENKGWKLRYGRVVDGQAIMISPDGFALNYSYGGHPHVGGLWAATPCVTPSPTSENP